MAGGMSSICNILLRKQAILADDSDDKLRRCLSIWDLTSLGVSSGLGIGMYVLLGSVAFGLAGPSVIISFLIAAIAALFSGLCYAEFAARVPKAGSAYVYTYVTVGQLAAFIVGWCMIFESLFGAASIARGLSAYVDGMCNNTMSEWFTSFAPISTYHLSPYFDFCAFLVVIVIGVLLAIGVRETITVNHAFLVVNVGIILFIICFGAFKADASNWYKDESEVPAGRGAGGFFPFGARGTLRGAAVCFYAFVGFDVISFAAEETKEARRVIPIAIICALMILLLIYTSVSIVVTMMAPYYLHETVASVATVFAYVGWNWGQWIVSIGGIFGILASLLGAFFPLPRLLYSMASDGLLLRYLAKISSRHTPLVATSISTFVIAILAGLLELKTLVLMMCVGTLMSYTVVAVCVILLRYRSDYPSVGAGYLKQAFGLGEKLPTRISSCIISIALFIFVCVCLSNAMIVTHVESPVIGVSLLHAAALVLFIVMMLQPQTKEELFFKTPLVPVIPCLSIYVNIHLMALINVQTWIRIAVWIVIGIPIYFICVYCYKHDDFNDLDEYLKASHSNINGKPPVQIVVETPNPPSTTKGSAYGGDHSLHQDDIDSDIVVIATSDITSELIEKNQIIIAEDIIVQHAIVEDNNEEKEAKIIDLLDQVLQAEEDSYGELISLKEQKHDDVVSASQENTGHRKSLSELSDAGSDASMGNQVLSKYDVIAQVHREDLPRVNEEEERADVDESEEITAFNESETNSRTDESGYSDTIDRIIESNDDVREDASNIPIPPPLDENFFKSSPFKKSFTISVGRTSKSKLVEPEEINKPRESVQSNNSQDDGTMVFGSDKQMHFMSKLNDIFQNKMSSENEGDEQRKRSHSTGNVADNTDYPINRERPSIFLDLKKELMSKDVAHNLRHISTENKDHEPEEEPKEQTLSREDLKNKLESIFAAGGPLMLKPRLMKSNPPTPEESYHTDTSSSESIAKLPKMEKNDTLKRQKDKFGDVLNSFRMSLNKDDDV